MNQPALAYSVAQASERTNITETKIWQAIKDDQIRTFKVGRSRLVSEEALQEFIRKLESKEIEISKQTYGK